MKKCKLALLTSKQYLIYVSTQNESYHCVCFPESIYGIQKPQSGFIANASLLLQSGSCHHGAPFYPPIRLYICSANLQTPMADTSIK